MSSWERFFFCVLEGWERKHFSVFDKIFKLEETVYLKRDSAGIG